jgi:proline iminopeptidase
MQNQKKFFMVITAAAAVLVLAFLGYFWLRESPERETIFDRVVSIPKELVLNVPFPQPWCDELPGLKKGFVDVANGGKLYYEEEGNGIPVVLINVGPGLSHQFFHSYFSQLKDSVRIIYYDQRGTGKSSADATGKTYTVQQAVEDLDGLRAVLQIDRWVVLGWSYGGLLAQCYALTYPERVMGLILGAAETGLPSNVTNSREQLFISQAEQGAIKNISTMAQEGKLTPAQKCYNQYLSGDWKRLSYYKPLLDESMRACLYDWSPAPGFVELISKALYSRSPESVQTINLQDKFADFEIPTLILEARWDLSWWDPKRAEAMRKNHPHAQVEMFEKSGHKIFADEPGKLFDLLRKFLHKAETTQITYKPGNRIEWPAPVSDLVRKLALAKSMPKNADQEKLFLACYDEALRDNAIDDHAWGRIANHFLQSKSNFDKCLTALQRLEVSKKKLDPETWQTLGYCVKAWQGHMLDLLGQRAEALECYREALKTNNGQSDNCFSGFMLQIDKKWLEDRLKTPFKWD